MKSKAQIIIVHGGMTFKNKKDYLHCLKTRPISLQKKVRWSGDYLDKTLGNSVEIIRLSMPKPEDAKYEEWKIHFERYLPHFDKRVILIGSSLGGIFLAKYLSENKFPKKTLSTYLICPPYDNTLAEEDLVGGFKLKLNLSLLEKNTKNLYLMFSKDDDVVPVKHAEKYADKLKTAKIIIFKSKNGHFKISTFPEIVKFIKDDLGHQ
ncbi:alpha/beta hydrolase [Candidatus Woesearchaeota archaeon]|nr:alpha/beta hydrolase [Candidatus Woesearchaeota archaeon]